MVVEIEMAIGRFVPFSNSRVADLTMDYKGVAIEEVQRISSSLGFQFHQGKRRPPIELREEASATAHSAMLILSVDSSAQLASSSLLISGLSYNTAFRSEL